PFKALITSLSQQPKLEDVKLSISSQNQLSDDFDSFYDILLSNSLEYKKIKEIEVYIGVDDRTKMFYCPSFMPPPDPELDEQRRLHLLSISKNLETSFKK